MFPSVSLVSASANAMDAKMANEATVFWKNMVDPENEWTVIEFTNDVAKGRLYNVRAEGSGEIVRVRKEEMQSL